MGAYLVLAVFWLFPYKAFKSNVGVIEFIPLIDFLVAPIMIPVSVFSGGDVEMGVDVTIALMLLFLCSPIMVVVIFVISLAEWSWRRYKGKEQKT